MTYAAVAVGGMSLLGGLSSSKSSKKAQKEANAIARETLNFNKQRYNDYKTMYGGLEQQLVNDANKGVIADLGGVTARAIGDTATQFKNQQAAQLRAQQRMGINPNSGRAESMARQSGIAQALGTAGNITTNREAERRNAEQQTWDRRAYVNNLGINQMNMAAQGVDNANTQLMNNYNNTAAQKAQQAGAFFGAAGAIGGKYLDGLSAAQSPNIQTSGIPTTNVQPSTVFQNAKKANALSPMLTTGLSGLTGINELNQFLPQQKPVFLPSDLYR